MKPLSILVVDDDEPTQQVLQLWLELHGHRVACRGDTKGATALLAQHTVDLVITDILMPDGDGLALIAQVRRTHPTVRILAISGGGPHATSSSCLLRAHSAGAHALLLKPFQEDQLLHAMRYVMGDASPAVRSEPTLRLFSSFDHAAAEAPARRSRREA